MAKTKRKAGERATAAARGGPRTRESGVATTTKPSGEGTGLGLSMSHDIIVKQHGGSIDVETEPGFFTEFKIVLPRTSQR
jgi:signal transduction histidine kinase